MKVKKFTEYIKELNHQQPMTLGVNDPGFGQGAHVGNWGADYGNPNDGVRGHFGKKGGSFSQTQVNFNYPVVVYDPYNDKHIHESDIINIVNDYRIRCKQNGDEPIEIDNINSDVIGIIQKYLIEN